jgi:hypothetical protein
LYILPFDHRGTFQRNMFGWTGAMNDEQTAKIAAMKQVIYDGFQEGVPMEFRRQRPASLWTSSDESSSS